MNKWLLAAVAAVMVTPSQAFPWHEYPPGAIILDWPGYSAYPAGTTFRKEIVQGAHPHWYQQQVPTVVPRMTYKEEIVRVKTWVNVAKVVQENQTALTYVPVPRLVDQEVVTCVIVPVFLTDPAGLPVVSCRVETKTHKVSYAVQDYKVVVKQYAVSVTKMVPQEKVVEYRQLVPVVVYDQQMTSQWQVMMVPYQKIVNVPTFDPNNAPHTFWP